MGKGIKELRQPQAFLGEKDEKKGGRSPMVVPGEFFLMAAVAYGFFVTMLVLAFYDYPLTLWLSEQKLVGLTKFMGQNLFDNGRFGGGDPGTLLVILAFVAYLSAWLLPRHPLVACWRPYWGFIVTASLISGVGMVHGLKWILARARPSTVFEGDAAYTGWFEMGAHFIAEGSYRGSLPSGHTATVLFLFTLAYVFAGDRYNPRLVRFFGLLWGAAALLYGLVMAICRTMALSHWLADCLFTFWMSWAVIHILYFWVLRTPLQARYWRQFGRHPHRPFLWELRFCLYCLFVSLSLVVLAFGLRAIMLLSYPWLSLLVIPGSLGILCGCILLSGLFRKIIRAYGDLPSTSSSTPDPN